MTARAGSERGASAPAKQAAAKAGAGELGAAASAPAKQAAAKAGAAEPGAAEPGAAEAGAAASPPAKRQRYELLVGAKKDSNYYLRASSSRYVVLVGSWAAEQMVNKKPTDLIEKPEELKQL